MKIEIKHRWTGNILFSVEADSVKIAVKLALEQKIVLRGADLRDAVLSGADLSGAVLSGADLRGADLRGAVLSGAVLSGAVLRDAVLSGAVLRGADLSGADLRGAVLSDAVLSGAVLRDAVLSGAVLRGADLSGADLRGAVLSDAVLSGAVLRDAVLTPIRNDFWNVLFCAPEEIGFLRQALMDGKIDGSAYQGECACLVGTIANGRKCNYQNLGILKPDSSRPAEVFFLAIRPGHTPKNSQFAKLAVEWLDQFVSMMKAAAPHFIETPTASAK